MSKEGSHCICLSVILIDSVFKLGKNYYPQVFWKQCRYVVQENKIAKFKDDELEISSDEYDEEISDEE